MTKYRMVCAECGSTEVVLQDAYVSWSVALQEWHAINARDCEGYCEICHEDCEINQEEIES